MKLTAIVAGAVILATLGACGSSPPPKPPKPPKSLSCGSGDSVAPVAGLVELEPPGQHAFHDVRAKTSLGCDGWVAVSRSLKAEAALTYGPHLICDLFEDPLSVQTAMLQSQNAQGDLFSVEPGKVQCTFGSAPTFTLCGQGSVTPQGPPVQGLAECAGDQVEVEVYSGAMLLRARNGQTGLVTASNALCYDPVTGKLVPGAARFSAAQRTLFSEQASELAFSSIVPPPVNRNPPPAC